MNNNKKRTPLIILGSIGNCLDIVDTVQDLIRSSKKFKFELKGFLDDNQSYHGKLVYGLPVLGPLSYAQNEKGAKFINGIGSSKNFNKKEDIINGTGLLLEDFISIVHPSSIISQSAKISEGTVVLGNVVISAQVDIGCHTMILPSCIVGHDCKISNYVTMGAGVVISGSVNVGQKSYLGAGSIIRENLTIGEKSLLGMGAVLVRDLPSNSIYVGNPAKGLTRSQRIDIQPAELDA